MRDEGFIIKAVTSIEDSSAPKWKPPSTVTHDEVLKDLVRDCDDDLPDTAGAQAALRNVPRRGETSGFRVMIRVRIRFREPSSDMIIRFPLRTPEIRMIPHIRSP